MRTKSVRCIRARAYVVPEGLERVVTKKRLLQYLRYFLRRIGSTIERFNLDAHVKSIDSCRQFIVG
jgi:hypothetical protein